jgi:predicted permease
VNAWWRRARRDEELDEEINAHLAMAARERVERGESPAEAQAAARREFGNVTQVKEVTRAMWGGAWLENPVREVRLAARSLRRTPGFLVIAVLALGLGLGLSTTMFAVLDAVTHPQHAFANADRMLFMYPRMSYSRLGSVPNNGELFQLMRDRVPSLDAVVPYGIMREPLQLGDEERDATEFLVPPAWFDAVGARAELGRTFSATDGEGVAVVSHEIWRSALGGRRDLAGARVRFGERTYAVTGVLPALAHGPDAYLPLRQGAEFSIPFARLRPGASKAQAQRELNALARELTLRYSHPGNPWALNLVNWIDVTPRAEVHDIHFAMVGSALAVLLIACVNLAHLMLARGIARRRELAVRMALGSSRAATVRLMLTEGSLIAAAGVALGAIVTVWGSHVLERVVPVEVSWVGFMRAQLSWRVFALGALAAVLSTTLFGLLPAIRVALAVRLTEPLQDEGGTTTTKARGRYSPLVIGEVALALALLMGGSLLLRAVHQLRVAPAGFDAETLVSGMVFGGYRFTAGPGGVDTVITMDWNQVLATAGAAPGVLAAALDFPHTTLRSGGAVTAELEGDSTRTITMQAYHVVSANYLRVHGLPVLRGRDFEMGDASGDGVAVLSAAAAARLYPRGDAVGRMVKLGGPAAHGPWVRIVGVARTPLAPWVSAGAAQVDVDPAPVWVARPFGKLSRATIMARLGSRRSEGLVRLRHALRTVPGIQVASLRPYTWERDAEIASLNFLARVFVAMGAVGLGLAALGLYGVLAYAVTRRMREFGVRIALGAEPRMLFRMVMHDGLVMLLAGTGIGAFVALAAAYLFNELLVGVYPTDAISLVIAEAALLVVGLAATLAPARRAVRASPLEVLRAV